ncbi:MAG: DGQHR domain-containing protein [Bacteroidota bacterium]
MTTDENIIVPALTGKFGEWRYYQLILKVKDLVQNFGTEISPNYRVKAVEEVEEIYSQKGVSKLLQRAFDPKRLEPMKNYILKQPDKYLNNLTIGIFGGNPDWYPMDISDSTKLNSEKLENLEKQIGFIELKGTETLFVLDGQHRLKGLRKAFAEKPKKIENDQIVCTLIIHHPNEKGRIRTRRLFSTINRHAKPVSKGENILLDEDDVSAIIVRKLIEEYKLFKNKAIIALSKGGNITAGTLSKFSTVVTLYEINEKLINHKEIYPKGEDGKIVRIRPIEKIIDKQKLIIFKYWNKFFELFPGAVQFIEDSKENRIKYRAYGGDFSLRPIAQWAIFEIIIACEEERVSIDRLKKLPRDVSNPFWHHILWNPFKEGMLFNRSLIRNYIKYNIGLNLKSKELERLENGYKKNSGDLELDLPKAQFN